MLVAKRSTSWQATPNNRAIATVLMTMKGVRRSRLMGMRSDRWPNPRAGEPHQLLTTNGNSRQHRRDLDVLNQQTIQQSQDQDSENPKAELKQPQTQTKSQRVQGRILKY